MATSVEQGTKRVIVLFIVAMPTDVMVVVEGTLLIMVVVIGVLGGNVIGGGEMPEPLG